MTVARRQYQDDVELSVIALGGIVLCKMDQGRADRITAEAIDAGVNYFDVAPSYFQGEAEQRMGRAIRGQRDRIFLACKTNKRDGASARRELEDSLRTLGTDHFDLYQFHGLQSIEEVDRILADGGAGEVFAEAQRKGTIRYIGFSTHSIDAGLALMQRAPFDIASVLFPLNYVCVTEGRWGPQLLDEAKRRGIARLALKAMARTRWPEDLPRQQRHHDKTWYEPIARPELAALALRWTLSHDITAAVPPGTEDLFRLAMETARDPRPLDEEQQQRLAAELAGLTPIFSTGQLV